MWVVCGMLRTIVCDINACLSFMSLRKCLISDQPLCDPSPFHSHQECCLCT